MISDESDHWHYAPVLKDIGGAYIGVSTNQTYEMVSWARSSLVFMVDFE